MIEAAAPVPVIDPHHHLWDPGLHTHPWLNADPPTDAFQGDMRPLWRTYLLDDYLEDARTSGLVGSVYVECGWDPNDPLGEARWVQSIADARGHPDGFVAHASLEDPGLTPRLDALGAFRGLRGIRQTLNWHRDPRLAIAARADLMDDQHWQAGLDLLGRRDLSFELSVYPDQMAAAAALAARHPEVQLILNHAGMPTDRDADGFASWRRGMRGLGAEANVAVKISGLGMFDHAWTVASIRPYVLGTIEAFGPDRCMFASNFPVDSLYGDFATLFAAYRQIVAGFTLDEQRRLFHDNAARIYRLSARLSAP